MSGKSRRKPVKLSVASSSIEEIKQEVEETAGYVQFLMAMKPDLTGLTLNQILNYTTQLENLVTYLCERNGEAGKVLEKIDPTAVRRKTEAQKEDEAQALASQANEPHPPATVPIKLEELPQMSDEDFAALDSAPKPPLAVVPQDPHEVRPYPGRP